MKADRKKLTELGPEVLADALLELAMHFEAADDLIEWLIATLRKNTQRYSAKLGGLKHRLKYD